MKKKLKRNIGINLFANGGLVMPTITLGTLLLNAPGISVDPSKVNIVNPNSATSASSNTMGTLGAVSGGIDLVTNVLGSLGSANNIPEVATPVALTTNATSNDSLLSEYNSWLPIEHITKDDLGNESTMSLITGALGAAGKGAASGAAIGSVVPGIGTAIGAIGGGLIGGIGSIFGSSSKNKKIRKLVRNTNKKIDAANNQTLNNFDNTASNIVTSNMNQLMANYSALGGLLSLPIPSVFSIPFNGGAIAYEGMQDLLNNQLVDNSKYNIPSFNNTFANGGDMSNGVTVFNTGGTHEENPYSGIPQGVGLNGLPNFVEEGEVKYNDYIFSNRVKPSKKTLKDAGMEKYNKKSFAEIAKHLSRESDERPNDWISKNGLDHSMNLLTNMQESTRASLNTNTFAKGGKKTTVTPFSINTNNLSLRDLLEMQARGLVANTTLNPDNIRALNTPEEIMGITPLTLSYINPNIINNTMPSTGTGFPLDSSMLRYAPVLGSALGLLTGSDYTPDYSGADRIAGLSTNFTPIGDYMEYDPLDVNYYLNMLNALSGATRRGIVNLSAGNRATATAGLLAADNNYLNSVGNLARQAEEFNLNQRQQVAQFNRGTNMYNSEGDFKALATNNDYALRAAGIRSDLANQAKQINYQLRAANFTNLFDSLGDIGREEYQRNMITSNPALYYDIDRSGNVLYKNTKAKGGKLNKRKKGLSYGI